MVDERIFWIWTHDQPGRGHTFDIKPRVFGLDYKFLSAVEVQVTTIFENVRSKKVNNNRKYTKEYGDGAACVLHLCEASGIEGSNHGESGDSWFVGIRCVLGLSKLGLQDITMIKTATVC